MNNPKIKICGMTDAANVLEIAALEPDFFGLIFYPKSPRYVAPEKARDLPHFANIRRIGVFVNETEENILRTAKIANLDFVQLHGSESPAFCAALQNESLKVIKAFAVGEDFNPKFLNDYEQVCDYFLFDTKTPQHGGSGKSFDWKILSKIESDKPFFLGGGISAENAAEAVAACENLPLYALDINSRAEISAGIKSADVINTIMNRGS